MPGDCTGSYNRDVKINRLHGWQVDIAQALDIQLKLAGLVSKVSEINYPRFIAGVDISSHKAQKIATGAVVVLSYPELRLVETKIVNEELSFPYIPGLLSFRESPLVLAACERLMVTPDLILVDGQGIAHPRRMGLASHLGLFLDTPTIGCAKSRLCGSHKELGTEPGSYADLVDDGEVIGAVLRTKQNTNPIYVSTGHKIDLQTAIHWVLECCRGYRVPEPTRLAHLAAGGNLRPQKDLSASMVGHQEKYII